MNNQIVFVVMALIGTLLPDIDIAFSTLGRYRVFRLLQAFVRHRGVIHSFSFAVLLSLIIAVFWPAASLGFFLGYGLHLFSDSFTKDGIQPFWPYKKRSLGFITTGGKIETTVLVIFIIVDLLLIVFRVI